MNKKSDSLDGIAVIYHFDGGWYVVWHVVSGVIKPTTPNPEYNVDTSSIYHVNDAPFGHNLNKFIIATLSLIVLNL